MKPTVGRIVHFYPRGLLGGAGPCAAIVTAVHKDDTVDLTVFRSGGMPEMPIERVGTNADDRSWAWPPRE